MLFEYQPVLFDVKVCSWFAGTRQTPHSLTKYQHLTRIQIITQEHRLLEALEGSNHQSLFQVTGYHCC